MWEFEFYNSKSDDYETHIGYSPADSLKNCPNKSDLKLIGKEYID